MNTDYGMTRFLSLLGCLALASTAALAQYGEFNVHGGLYRLSPNKIGTAVGETSGATFDSLLDNGWMFGARTTLNQASFFGHEFGYNYNRTSLRYRPQNPNAGVEQKNGMATHRGFYNFLLYATPEGSRVRPFVTGGAHFANFVQPGASVQYGQGDNKFGVNYGAGVKFRLTDRYMIRFDLREYLQGKPFGQFLTTGGGVFRNQEYSIGFSYTL
jgi:opacity protein-like surface antigen